MRAEEILRQRLIKYLESGKDSSEDRAAAINEAMIAFAKHHVKKFSKSPCSVTAYLKLIS